MTVKEFEKIFTENLSKITTEQLISDLEAVGVEFEEILPINIPILTEDAMRLSIPVYPLATAGEYNNNSNNINYVLAA